jgi:hypothetical protein
VEPRGVGRGDLLTRVRLAIATLLAALASGCAPLACQGVDCEQLGWLTNHWLCDCAAGAGAGTAFPPPVPPPPPPAPPPVFVAAYRTNHPCLAHATRVPIDEAIAFMKEHPTTHAQVSGYADPTERNTVWLADRRALVVARYMTANGIAEDRLAHHGYDAERPVADSSTAAGRRQNRRVEIQMTDE